MTDGQALRGAQVLEPVLPEVAQRDARWRVRGDERLGGVTEDDLAPCAAAVTRAARLMARPITSIRSTRSRRCAGRSGRGGHAGGPRVGGQGTLRVDGRGNGVAGTAEDDEEGIALGALLVAAVGLEGRSGGRDGARARHGTGRCCSSSRRVDPSMSLKRQVTSPVGRAARAHRWLASLNAGRSGQATQASGQTAEDREGTAGCSVTTASKSWWAHGVAQVVGPRRHRRPAAGRRARTARRRSRPAPGREGASVADHAGAATGDHEEPGPDIALPRDDAAVRKVDFDGPVGDPIRRGPRPRTAAQPTAARSGRRESGSSSFQQIGVTGSGS